MREKFVKNFAFLLLANFVVKPLWIFGVDRSIQVSTGPIEYGHYFTATNFSFLFSVILDLGINNFTNRAVSRNAKRAGEYMYNLLRLKMLLAFDLHCCYAVFCIIDRSSRLVVGVSIRVQP
jgi:O-antigen/teichoic acid export membrane protein